MSAPHNPLDSSSHHRMSFSPRFPPTKTPCWWAHLACKHKEMRRGICRWSAINHQLVSKILCYHMPSVPRSIMPPDQQRILQTTWYSATTDATHTTARIWELGLGCRIRQDASTYVCSWESRSALVLPAYGFAMEGDRSQLHSTAKLRI